jgi:ABC-type Na+ efflux pump permease subunit
MKKFWLVCMQEYKHHVLNKRFIFGVLSMPLFVGAIALVSFLSIWLQYDNTPVGYVDTYKILDSHLQPPKEENALLEPIVITEFPDEFAARAALDRKEIQAYYVLADNYLSTGEVKMVSAARTGMNIEGDFGDFLRFNLLN